MRVTYEVTRGCVHTLSLHCPYWLVNHTHLSLLIREAGATHGFGGEEASVVREVVCENQRRTTVFSDFSAGSLFPTDTGPFSDARTRRPHSNLAAVWLPPGWVWLDDAWSEDGAGWQYATHFGGPWFAEAGSLRLVRQRRWCRHRARVDTMGAGMAARIGDDAIDAMHAPQLRELIASGGLGYRDCATTDALRARAKQARDTAKASTGRRTAFELLEESSLNEASSWALGGGVPISEPLMPPVGAGRGVQVQLPGSSWSPELHLDAVGTHGLLEVSAARRDRGAVGAVDAGSAHGWYQLVRGSSNAAPLHPPAPFASLASSLSSTCPLHLPVDSSRPSLTHYPPLAFPPASGRLALGLPG